MKNIAPIYKNYFNKRKNRSKRLQKNRRKKTAVFCDDLSNLKGGFVDKHADFWYIQEDC